MGNEISISAVKELYLLRIGIVVAQVRDGFLSKLACLILLSTFDVWKSVCRSDVCNKLVGM